MRRIPATLVLSTVSSAPVLAVLVAPNSPCSTKCGNVLGATTPADIVCLENEYSTSAAGPVFSQCITCESTSSYTYNGTTPEQSDLEWMLYNLRYAFSSCLFGFGGNKELGDNPCITSKACGPLKDAFELDSLATNTSTYSYCSVWDEVQSAKCSECVLEMSNGHYLNNFLSILDGACQFRPPDGETLSLKGSIFSTQIVNVSAPSATATFTSHALNTGSLSLGDVVGIAIGGVCGILIITGICVVCIGKRRRRAYLSQREERIKKDWPSPQAGGPAMFQSPTSPGRSPFRGYDDTPMSQRPLRGWEDSPVSAATDHGYPRYFSPYSSHYNSPVSAIEGPGRVAWPEEKTQNIGLALSPDVDLGGEWYDRKGKDKMETNPDREAYEMQEVAHSGGGHAPAPYVPAAYAGYTNDAPVLNHPGYGRKSPSPPRPPNAELNEEDARQGRAF